MREQRKQRLFGARCWLSRTRPRRFVSEISQRLALSRRGGNRVERSTRDCPSTVKTSTSAKASVSQIESACVRTERERTLSLSLSLALSLSLSLDAERRTPFSFSVCLFSFSLLSFTQFIQSVLSFSFLPLSCFFLFRELNGIERGNAPSAARATPSSAPVSWQPS